MTKSFEKEEKYKLYRSIEELFHPSISKKNISDYKIIIGEDLYPIRVFYPKKVSSLDKVIIFIHGEPTITNSIGEYSKISDKISKNTNKLVISIDYEEKDIDKLYDILYNNVKVIYNELLKHNINKESIIIMGDSTGGSIVLNILKKFNRLKKEIDNIVLFYPVLSGEYYGETKYTSIKEKNAVDYKLIEDLKNYYKDYKGLSKFFALRSRTPINCKKLTILCGKADPLLDEAIDFLNKHNNVELKIIDFANHGFLNSDDKEINKELKNILSEI